MTFFETESSAAYSRDKTLSVLVFATSAFLLTAIAINLFTLFFKAGKNVSTSPSFFQDVKRLYAPLIKYYPGVIVFCLHVLVATVVFWELYRWLDTQSAEGIKMDALTEKSKKYHAEDMKEFHQQSAKLDQVISTTEETKKDVEALSVKMQKRLNDLQAVLTTEIRSQNEHVTAKLQQTMSQLQQSIRKVDALTANSNLAARIQDLKEGIINFKAQHKTIKGQIELLEQKITYTTKEMENLKVDDARGRGSESNHREYKRKIRSDEYKLELFRQQRRDFMVIDDPLKSYIDSFQSKRNSLMSLVQPVQTPKLK